MTTTPPPPKRPRIHKDDADVLRVEAEWCQRELQLIFSLRGIQDRFRALDAKPPNVLRRLCAHLRRDLRFAVPHAEHLHRALRTMEQIWTIVKVLSQKRIVEDAPELVKQKMEVQRLVAQLEQLVVHTQESMLVISGMRVLSNMLSPAPTITVRNPCFDPVQVRTTITTQSDQRLIIARALDIVVLWSQSEALFYALRILIALSSVSCELIASRVQANERHCTFLITLATRYAIEGDTLAGAVAHNKEGDQQVTSSSASDISLLALRLVAKLVEMGYYSTFTKQDGGLIIARLLENIKRICKENRFTPSDDKYLDLALNTLRILFKRQPMLCQRLIKPDDISRFSNLLLHFGNEATLRTSVCTAGADVLNAPRSLCYLTLQCVQSNLLESGKPGVLQQVELATAIGRLGMALRSASMSSDTEGAVNLSTAVELFRPSLVIPLIDVLQALLPTTDVLVRCIEQGVVTLLVQCCWSVVASTTYEAKYPPDQVARLQNRLLKTLTFLVSNADGMFAFSHLQEDELKPLHQSIEALVRHHLCGHQPLGGSESDTSEDSFDSGYGTVRPTLGHRALRLLSVLMEDKDCRMLLTDQGILDAVINVDCLGRLLNVHDLAATFATASLVFVVLDKAAVDSNIRFRMRNGDFHGQSDKAPERQGDLITRPLVAPECTVIHFCLGLFLVSVSSSTSSKDVERYMIYLAKKSAIFVCGNYQYDETVTSVLLHCPSSVFQALDLSTISQWSRNTTHISALDCVLQAVCPTSHVPTESLLELDLTNDMTTPHSVPDECRLAAAELLDFLIIDIECHRRLMHPLVLRRLAFVAAESGSVSRLVSHCLSRILIRTENLPQLVAICGFSAILEPLVDPPAEALSYILTTLTRHQGVFLTPLLHMFASECRSRAGTTRDSGDAVAMGMVGIHPAMALAYCAGDELITQALSRSQPVSHSAVFTRTQAVNLLTCLLTTALSDLEIDYETSKLVGLGEKEWEVEYVEFRARAVIKYLSTCRVSALGKNSGVGPVDQRAVGMIDQLFAMSLTDETSDDTVYFLFPDDHNAVSGTALPIPLGCSRDFMAQASPVLHAMLTSGFLETVQQTLRLHEMERGTWELVIKYLIYTHTTPPSNNDHPTHTKRLTFSNDDDGLLSRVRRVLLLIECADRFLIEHLRDASLQWVLYTATEAMQRRDGVVGLVIWRWIKESGGRQSWSGVGIRDVVGRIEDAAFGALVVSDWRMLL
ncbi:hypothetical protein BC832DRAFT_566082 [Gaertneriomyces semiglobifer]|nr:hypothetical protein BC832DRAFT_566082 [Gaertneriomyces semiglobifer]